MNLLKNQRKNLNEYFNKKMEEAVARAEFMELAKNLHRKYILKI